MAVTDQQKLDFLLKKIGYTKTKTGSVVGTGAISGTPKQPFAEAIPSPLIIANGALWNHKTFPVPITRVFDVTGAGDTFLAALVFYYIQLPSLDESINFANKCAAIAVQNPGTYTLTMEDVDAILY